MLERRRNSSPFFAILMIIALGVVGGIVGGVYFFVIADSDPPATTPVFEPPGQEISQVQPETTTDEPTAEVDSFPHILIPSAGVEEVIVTSYLRPDGWQIDHLRGRVGHLEGTAWINDPKNNIVLAGHVELADGSKGAFADIDEMETGDEIVITEKGIVYTYRVTEVKEVEPDDLTVVYPSDTPRVTLITCGDYSLLTDQYGSRVVVVAELVG